VGQFSTVTIQLVSISHTESCRICITCWEVICMQRNCGF